MIAAVSAIALLIIMFVFDWFSVDVGDDALGIGVDTGANAWTAFSFIDIVLFVTILAAIGLALMAANAQRPDLPVAGSAIVTGLAILSLLLIIYRLIDPPGGGDIPEGLDISIAREIGVFLGLLATAGIAYGGYKAMQEEGTSFSQQGDRLQQRGPGDPPPPTAGGTPPAV